jgi:hypothetical protein
MVYAPNENVTDAIKRAGLPRNHDIHWSKARKEEVVQAVREKLISFDEARWRYLLSHASSASGNSRWMPATHRRSLQNNRWSCAIASWPEAESWKKPEV